jgi:hypothetical protein
VGVKAERREPTLIGVNRYGEAVRRHWEQQLPGQHARIEDPESFFALLGEYAALIIDELADDLAGDDPPGEGYLDKVVRLTAARRLAEQEVIADLRPAPAPAPAPAPDDDEGGEDDDELASTVPALIIWRGCPSLTGADTSTCAIHAEL